VHVVAWPSRHLGCPREGATRAAPEDPGGDPDLGSKDDRPGGRVDQAHADHHRAPEADDHHQPEHLSFGAKRVVHRRLLSLRRA
jgi:hypothetical protein